MSWQGYIDSSLVGSGHIDKAAIISAAGDSVWATSPELKLKPEEMKTFATILEGSQAAIDKAFADGVYLEGIKHVATNISAEDQIIMARQGKQGIAVAKTKQAIVVGHYGENAQAGSARQTVEALAEYLRKVGY